MGDATPAIIQVLKKQSGDIEALQTVALLLVSALVSVDPRAGPTRRSRTMKGIGMSVIRMRVGRCRVDSENGQKTEDKTSNK
ncbi:MAG: hypothetical protein OXC18_15790 [Desulfurellaceae bacterium]|nr:hypothetical protein [Desulfurellaceae bacterium]